MVSLVWIDVFHPQIMHEYGKFFGIDNSQKDACFLTYERSLIKNNQREVVENNRLGSVLVHI